jgi:Immunoglobulin I-set domain
MMTAPTITTQPTNASVTVGQTATFSVTATGSAPLSYQWMQGSTAISGATSASYATPATIAANSGEQFQVQVSNTAGSVTSNMATLTVTASSTASADVVTHHYDVSRSGVNAAETALTTSNVNSTTFGKVGEFSVDGQIDSQALYLSQLAIPGQGTKNVLYVATEKDSVYAVDADSISGTNATVLWKSSVLGSGEAPADAGSLPCGNINPNGVTATPVIDRGRNAIYVEAMSKSSTGSIIHRLHALDLTTGKELFGGNDYGDISGNRRKQPRRNGHVRSTCTPRKGGAAGKWRQHLYRVVGTGRRLRRLFGLGNCV